MNGTTRTILLVFAAICFAAVLFGLSPIDPLKALAAGGLIVIAALVI